MSQFQAFIVLLVGLFATAAGLAWLIGPIGLVAVGVSTVGFALLVDDERK